MRKKSSITLGPGAPSLILICVVLSMTVLGMLAQLTARNDLRFSRRSAEVAETVYALRERAEERRAAVAALYTAGGEEAVDAALAGEAIPDILSGLRRDGDELVWEERAGTGGEDTQVLFCALRVGEGMPWTAQRLTTRIGSESAAQRRDAALLALEEAMTARQARLDAALAPCAEAAASWEDYLARVDEALGGEPALSGITREGDLLRWVESDGTYAYACEVRLLPTDSGMRTVFTGVPEIVNAE